jgi:hypothetical protein
MRSSAEARLDQLIRSGQLRFVYVLGLARSSSTIVCRVLGGRLDGAVYEPATPAALDRRRHFARTILSAYDRARARVGEGRPVALAIKDLSLFLDDPAFEAVAARASHIVFTVREPAAQFASLRRQLAHEFSPLERVDAVLRHPFEALWMAGYFLVYGRRFIAEARAALGPGPPHRLAMAGWNLRSYANLERQMALFDVPTTLLDADTLRRDPARAEALLAAIAAPLAPVGPRANVEIAAHSRMLPRSKWAAEALSSPGISAGDPAPPPAPPDPLDAALLARNTAAYQRICARHMHATTDQRMPATGRSP